jgi:FkbM family methyltransferase
MQPYTFRRGLLESWRWRFKRSLYKRLTRRALPVFTLGGDVISVNPQVHGVYEPQVMHLIETAAAQGMNHFFVDIGANIGLIACQAAPHFRKLILFEPNPQVLPILHANTSRWLHATEHEIHAFALGTSDSVTQLRVPRGNLGGAFIQDAGNSYSATTLARKDGFAELDARNYESIDIPVRNGKEVLARLAIVLKAQGFEQGVFKLDVEGYEPVVLEAILEAFKHGFRFMVVLECQSDGKDIAQLARRYGSGRLLQVTEYPDRKRHRWTKSLRMLFAGGRRWYLAPYAPQPRKTDIVYFNFDA